MRCANPVGKPRVGQESVIPTEAKMCIIQTAAKIRVTPTEAKICVTPTEAADSLIVRCAVEGPPHFAFAFVRSLVLWRTQNRVPHPLRFHRKGWVIERSETVLLRSATTSEHRDTHNLVASTNPPA